MLITAGLFARVLVEQVRDRAIQCCDSHLKSPRGLIGKRWHDIMQQDNPEVLVNALIPDIVDFALFYLLNSIDQGMLNISVYKNGNQINLTEEGQEALGGYYLPTGEGWVAKYSKERYFDYFSDIKL
jgi:hypothetical protein